MSSQPARGTTLTTPIRGVSPASGMAAWRRAGVVVLTLASAVLAAPAWGADDAVAARERGAAVIDAFVDHYRRTGDPTSKLCRAQRHGARAGGRGQDLYCARRQLPAPPKP